MDIKDFEQKIEKAQARLENWLQKLMEVSPNSERLSEATEEIMVGLEELQVATEELYHQQEQLETANREAEAERQRYLELFDYAPDGYLITNRWGIIQEANLTATEMLNRRQDHLVGKPLSIFIPETERRPFYFLLHRLRQQETIAGVEIEIQPSNHCAAFTAAISIAFVRDEQDRIVGFRWLLRDISELRKAQIENQRQQERSQLIAEIALKIRQSWQLEAILQTAVTESQKLLQTERVVIFQLESDNTVTAIAEASSKDNSCFSGQNFICGFLPAEHSSLSKPQNNFGLSQVIPGYYFKLTNQTQSTETIPQPEITNLIAPIYVRQKLWGFLAFHRCQQQLPNSLPPSPQWQEFEIEVCEQLADQIGIAVSHAEFILNMEQLVATRTEELRASNLKLQQEIEERLRLEESLRQSKNGVYLIADSLPILIAYVNNQQHFHFSNKAYELWFGKSVKEIYRSHLQEVLGETIYGQIEDKVDTVLSGQDVVFEMQLPYRNADLRWVNINFIHHHVDQKVQGFFALIEDINERKEIEQMKDEFVSVVSHELRTPLTSIHGSLRLLNAGKMGSLEGKSQQLVELAEKNTDRLVRLVNDILDLQRLDSGKTTIKKQPCNTADLISTAAETMQEMARQQSINIEYDPTSIPLVADPDCILQTLTNLIGNAIKFSDPNSSITIQATERIQDILFQVGDRGRGIPANKLESIFERFQQVDVSDARQKQGTGLGLSICRQIVELHQGKIWVESIVGEGSTFYFTLPK
ncbi:MAG: ATP-binding protein [Cyanobacteria bacterium P01_G01_bin.19]